MPRRDLASSTDLSQLLPGADWRQRFRRSVWAWFARHGRDLPWRQQRDPYAVWVSEIMLQQTTVAAVRPYFERFLRAFPSIDALATADQQQVLRLWEGLGYYRRARQLHEAARTIAALHGGRFPQDPEAVRRLPGIGRYTAGAILSIAFDRRLPILEANTQRLFSRLLGYAGDPHSAGGQRLLWTMAEAVLSARDAGRFNQALMDLGSLVCLPRGPQCERCPVARLCQANLRQLQAEIPAAKVKPAVTHCHEAAVVVRRRGRVLLVQCAPGERWAGLWDFPRFPLAVEDAAALDAALVEGVRRRTGVLVRPGRLLRTIKHTVTRFRITLDCYEATYVSAPGKRSGALAVRWLLPAELHDYPLSSPGRKLASSLTS